MNKAIFLDRDGTINIDEGYIYKISDFKFTYKAIEALRILQQMGFMLFIMTNQSGIARGYYTEHDVKILHQWLKDYLYKENIKIEEIYYCPHHLQGTVKEYSIECNCRKPKISMFLSAIKTFNIDPLASYAIGDKLTDLEISKCLNSKSILLKEDEDIEGQESEFYKKDGIIVKKNLYDAALYISSI